MTEPASGLLWGSDPAGTQVTLSSVHAEAGPIDIWGHIILCCGGVLGTIGFQQQPGAHHQL